LDIASVADCEGGDGGDLGEVKGEGCGVERRDGRGPDGVVAEEEVGGVGVAVRGVAGFGDLVSGRGYGRK